MNEQKNSFLVSDTAALVMLWALAYYEKQPLVGSYLRELDLSAGEPLVERYNRVCPWYSEVIINRKHFIRKMVEDLVRNDPKPTIIANLGAGLSPLALELSPLLNERTRFIEIDIRNMNRKHEIYSWLIPDRCRFISSVEADIANIASLEESLSGCIENPGPTRLIVVMEGLTYYVGRPAMEGVLGALSGLVPDLAIVFEHLKPCRLVSDERRYIPYLIFSHVRDYTGLDRMTTYSEAEIQAVMGPDFSCSYYDMDEMEWQRTGSHGYFPTPGSGWLSCAVARKLPVP